MNARPKRSFKTVRLSLIGAALVCILGALVAAPAGAAPWQPAVELSQAGTYNSDVEAAFDGAGNALAIWRHSTGEESVQVAEKPAGGTWQAPVDVWNSPYPPASPELAVNSAGDAVAVWSAWDGSGQAVWAARRSAGGAWQTPVVISEPGLNSERARVAIDPDGTVVVTWEGWTGERFMGGEGVVQAAQMTAAGVWGAPVTLSSNDEEEFTPDVAFDSAGAATVVWQQYAPGAAVIEADELPSGGSWQPPIALSLPAVNAIEAHVAADAEGGLVAIWARWDGSNWIIQGSTRPAAGSWAPPADISAPGRTALSPRLAVAASGQAVAVWQVHVAQYVWMVQGASGIENLWEAPVDLSSAAEIGEPQVATDPAGDAVVSWIINNQNAQVATKTADGVWQAPTYVPQYPASHAKVAVDPSGNAIVVSQHVSFSGPESGVQATEHDAIRLSVNKTGSGSGTVSSAPDGIECGPVCSAQFEDESSAALTAEAAAGSEFTGWSGACSGTGPCSVALAASRSVSADFRLSQPQPQPSPPPQPDPQPQPKPVVPTVPGSEPPAVVCNAVAASAGTYVPTPGPGRTVAGVRVKVSVASPAQVVAEPTLIYADGGSSHHLRLAPVSFHTTGAQHLRMAVPTYARSAVQLGDTVAISLRIAVTPDDSPSCAPALSTRHLKVKVMRVLVAPRQ